MEITILGSGSSGNCYHLSDGLTPVLIECGLPISSIKRGTGFRLSEVAGCLVSHEHGDHAKAISDLMKAGVDCYASRGTLDALGIRGHRAKALDSHAHIGSWTVTPFEAVHDAAEPLGFVLDSTTGERVFYSGDTAYIKPRVPGMTRVMVECNNSWDAIRNGAAAQSLKRRVVETHMSLDTVLNFLAANDLSRVREIILLHLSDDHSDEEAFKRAVQEATGKVVRVA